MDNPPARIKHLIYLYDGSRKIIVKQCSTIATNDARINYLEDRIENFKMRLSSVKCPSYELENQIRIKMQNLKSVAQLHGITIEQLLAAFEGEIAVLLAHLKTMEQRLDNIKIEEDVVTRIRNVFRAQLQPSFTSIPNAALCVFAGWVTGYGTPRT